MPYFIAGEYNFSQEGSSSTEGQRYFAKSLLFPPQSSILGMLRKQILRAYGLLKIHKNGEWIPPEYKQKAKEVVGDKAFVYDEKIELGIIHSMS
jgi:CRISPR-associated protein Cmr3